MAHPDALVINVAGEASWLMNMQEMGTAVQYRLPVKQFILNNERLGMVRQWQELAAWRALFAQLVRGAARFREAGRGLRLQGHHGARTPPISTTRSWRCWTMTAR
jgi:thiamine pyrophosphate-dependent acetolactate synthase large subunit-like protein